MADEFTKAALYWIKTFNKKVKEKIWMEKLIELLNEYSKKKHNLAMRELNWEYWLWFHYLNYWSSYSELLMVSKKYEFIKRLVENDKIDFSKFEYMINIKANKRELYYTKAGFHTEALLMLLSIQDEPIEYLISILK